VSAEAELARVRAKNAERQRRWRQAHGAALTRAFAIVRDAHLDEWRSLCAAYREADPEAGYNAIYRTARADLLRAYPDEWAAAKAEAGA
jgi:hypothetical protein